MDETKQPAVKEMTPDELAEFQAHLNGVSNVIRVEGGSLPQNVAHAERALAAATRSDPERGIYQRGGVLVRIARLPRATVTDGIRRAAGTLQIMTAGSDFLRMKLTEAVAWERLDKRRKQFIPTDAPLAVARTLADCAGGWLSTPNLTGVIECPVLRPDGSILSRPGYDEASGLYLDCGNTTFPAIPDSPNREDALFALDLLRSILKGFPFISEADRSVALALLITPVVRYAIRSAPMTAISAPKMASGKTLLASLPAYLATGREPALVSQAETPEEERKRLLALLLEGSTVTVIDNCERPLRSDVLCTALTEPVIRGRLLGMTRTVSAPTTTTWVATGNNLHISGDLSSRTLLCTLDPQCERPEERKFSVDLHEQVPKFRGELVSAALTIVRAYIVAGCPDGKVPVFGRYEEWSRYVRQPLVWLGLPDPCETKRVIEARDSVRNELGNLLQAWYDAFGSMALKVADAIKETETNAALKTALEAIAEERGGRINSRRLGNYISRHERRIERGLRFERDDDKQGVAMWRVRKQEA